MANQNPKSFLSGSLVDLDKVLQQYNRAEFHHIYPKAYLKDEGFPDDEINCLANFCFLSASENKKIGRKKPSEYKTLMPSDDSLNEILDYALCPANMFDDDFKKFINERAKILVSCSNKLIQI